MLTDAAYEAELKERGRAFLESVGREAKSLWGTHGLMGLGVDPKRVDEIVRGRFGTVSDGPFGRVAAGTFDIFYMMFLVSRWEDRLCETTVAHIRQVMTEGVLERGNTENHWLMYYVGNLLAAERWPEVEVWWNGLPREAMHAEATRWILGTIDRTAREGHHEYDSTQYHGWHLLPMIALADHAEDPHMKKQATQMATLLVADMALEYFQGAWAGGHSREISRRNTWTLEGTSSALGYYYFGGVALDPVHAREDAMCPAMNAQYRPPAMFAEMARDRSRADVVKKTKAPRTIYRHVDRESEPVRKYTYMSRSFALGSTQAGLPGPPAGPIDLVTWDLTWSGPKHRAKLVCNHPYLDPGRFSAFLSEVPQVIGRSVPAAKPFLQSPDRLFGGSPYEQMVQHEGAILILYRVPKDDAAPYVNLYLPKGIGWVEKEGWILGDAGG
ncbi:MAG: hypothetical protein O2954_17205, partial [bacterium]|nr:hypothetical protein [bacterium]